MSTQHAPDAATPAPSALETLAATVAPATPASDTPADAETRAMAALFVREPELVLAHLESSPFGGPGPARVLAAAEYALSLKPRYADLHYFAGHAARHAGDLARAAALLSRSLELNPWYKDALILAGRVAQERGDLERARRLLESAITIGADYPDVRALLRDVRLAQGEVAAANETYARTINDADEADAAPRRTPQSSNDSETG